MYGRCWSAEDMDGAVSKAMAGEEPPTWLLAAFRNQEIALQRLLEQQHEVLVRGLEQRFRLIDLSSPRPSSEAVPDKHVPQRAPSSNDEHPAKSGDASDNLHGKDLATLPDVVIESEDSESMSPLAPPRRTSSASGFDRCPVFRRMIRSRTFDLICLALIVLNMMTMFLHLQLEGYMASYELGLHTEQDTWPEVKAWLVTLEIVFSGLYIVELILRVSDRGPKFFADVINSCDAAVVLVTSADSFVFKPLGLTLWSSFAAIRLVRIFRVVRILKVVRFISHFRVLRVLITSLNESIHIFLWSIMVLAVIILVSGMFLALALSTFVLDDSQDLELRTWVYNYYGSALRATYSMFEITFSGSWPARTRPLVDDVSHWFGVFFVLYIVMIAFAVTRVIAALFLKQTLQVASSDEDMVVMEKMKMKDQYAKKLRQLFMEIDTSGDGIISRRELQEMCTSQTVGDMLHVLELEQYEIAALWNILDDGKSGVPFEEFLSGAMRLKGNARSIDAISISHEQHKIKNNIEHVCKIVEKLSTKLGTASHAEGSRKPC